MYNFGQYLWLVLGVTISFFDFLDFYFTVEEVEEEESKSDSSDDSSQNKPSSNDQLCSEGPHFDLMKIVLKKHLLKEPKSDYFGFYCDVCKAFSADEKLWLIHVASPSHSNRMVSPEVLGKTKYYDCNNCNIQLICDTEFYSWHEKSIAHRAVGNGLKNQTNLKCESKQEVHKESGKERYRIVKTGIYLKGNTCGLNIQ